MSETGKINSTDEMNEWVKDAMDDSESEKAQMISDGYTSKTAIARRREVMLRMVEFKELLMRNACAIKECGN